MADCAIMTDRIRRVTDRVENEFGTCSDAQLAYQPGDGSWSISECLDHIIKTNEAYFEKFEPIVNGHYRKTIWMRINPFTRLLGRNMINELGVNVTRKFKTPQMFKPENNVPGKIIFQRFLDTQKKFERYLKQFGNVTIDDIVIYSPVSSVITISLNDVLTMLTGHEERHVEQAHRILKSPSFPKG